jgi:signal transduction histidine kinase
MPGQAERIPVEPGLVERGAASAPGARPWSLQRRVLVLSVAVTAIAWLVGGTAMYLIERHVSDALFDQRLRDIAGALLTFADHEINELQEAGGDIVHMEGALTLGRRYRYQIWSRRGELLLVSVATERTPFAPFDAVGFSDRDIGGEMMRVVVMPSDDGRKMLEVAEPLSARLAPIDPGMFLLAIPLLLSLALLVGVSAILMRRATRALGESASQVTQRSPGDLRPLEVSHAPQELTPIVTAVNSLFARIQSALATERRFTSDAAHELRTPLAAIKIQAQVALLTHDEPERRRALERLMHSIDGAAHMVDQLLTMSRIDGLMGLSAQAVRMQLDSVAAHVIDEMRPLTARRDQRIIEELAAADIDGLEFGIAVLLRNLLDNAARYGPAGGSIRVRTGTAAGACFVSVEDQGPGIDPAQRQRVFERFYRQPTNADVDGCGIGLSIVQAVVQMHGARIALDRSDLGGLSVSVHFPPAATAAAPNATVAVPSDPVLAS